MHPFAPGAPWLNQDDLGDVRGKLTAFKGVDINDLKGQIAKLTGDLTTKEAEWQGKLADIEFTRTLEGTVSGAKPKNQKAVMAPLDVDKLKTSKNQQFDLSAPDQNDSLEPHGAGQTCVLSNHSQF